MAAADYRLMTEATGQRIAAALEALTALGDPVGIIHGGHGATTAAGALSNLGAFPAANVYNGTDKSSGGYALDARQGKVLLDRINVLIGMIASEYSNRATYIADEVVIYQNNLYRCITPITTAEGWTAAHWERTTISHELAYKLSVKPIPNIT